MMMPGSSALDSVQDNLLVATGVSEAEYMERYAAEFCEYVAGNVFRMMPVTLQHDDITRYLRLLLDTYFALRPIGRALAAPYVMKASAKARRHEPDLQIILKTNPGEVTETAMLGPADICIEVVSEGSEELDYGTKFVEYERAGVNEYWLLDSVRRDHRFFRLNEHGIYMAQPLASDGTYSTPLLPGLKLDVDRLWQMPLPDPIQTVQAIQSMLKDS
jgi:Uma2 family endonuclease